MKHFGFIKNNNLIKLNLKICTDENFENMKNIFKNELPCPLRGYTSMIYYNFSVDIGDVCENFYELIVDSSVDKCFTFLEDQSNLILWNPFIYQIFNKNSSFSIIHCFLRIGKLPTAELIVPNKWVFIRKNELIEFQNSTKCGVPFCGRIFFMKQSSSNKTKISFFIRFPLPNYAKELKISSSCYSLMIQEIFKKNTSLLKNKIENH